MIDRRTFLAAVGTIAAGVAISNPIRAAINARGEKLKVVLIGTGVRGSEFWGKRLVDEYGDVLEFIGLVDHNESRLQYAATFIGVDKNCGLYTTFEDMIAANSPDLIMVTTTDATHHLYIIKALENGVDVFDRKAADNG